MKKYNIQKYFLAFAGITAFFIFSWLRPVLYFLEFLKTEGAPVLREFEVFLNIMGPNGNFITPMKTAVIYLVLLIFGLSFVFFKDKPSFLIRLKSRKAYINKHLFDILLFSFLFVFLLEAVNIIGAFFIFDPDLIINFKFIQYSLIDFVTLFLFYTRAGLMLFIIGVVTNKKFAPFITFAIYFIEFFAKFVLPFLNAVWLPYKDAVCIIYLLTGDMQPTDAIFVVVRGIIMNAALIVAARFLFIKKDIINHEKK